MIHTHTHTHTHTQDSRIRRKQEWIHKNLENNYQNDNTKTLSTAITLFFFSTRTSHKFISDVSNV